MKEGQGMEFDGTDDTIELPAADSLVKQVELLRLLPGDILAVTVPEGIEICAFENMKFRLDNLLEGRGVQTLIFEGDIKLSVIRHGDEEEDVAMSLLKRAYFSANRQGWEGGDTASEIAGDIDKYLCDVLGEDWKEREEE
jgi:hypothetical protein